MNALPKLKSKLNIPIASIKCNMQISLYRRKEGSYVKCKEYLERETTKLVYSVKDDVIEIEEGYFIQGINSTQFQMFFGEIIITGENACTCSKNGYILRKLKKGKKLKVTSIVNVSEDVTIYGINELEFISSNEDIQHVMGFYILEEEVHLKDQGQLIKYRKGELFPFQGAEEDRIQLLDGTWLNIGIVKGRFEV